MTRDEAKAAALRWLDEATSGGLALEAETTADLKDRMDHLMDGAVAAVCGRFPHYEVYSVEPLPASEWKSGDPAYTCVQLPEDMTVLTEVRLCCADGQSVRFSDYRRTGQGTYTVPYRLTGRLELTYIRRPAVQGADAAGSAELDVPPAAACLVPLRLAADVLTGVDDTAVLAGYLTARYNELAAAIYRRPEPDPGTVECVYAQ